MAHVAQSSSSTWQFWIDVTGCSFSLAWPLVVAGIREVAQQSSAPISTSKTKQHKMEASFIAKKKKFEMHSVVSNIFHELCKKLHQNQLAVHRFQRQGEKSERFNPGF